MAKNTVLTRPAPYFIHGAIMFLIFLSALLLLTYENIRTLHEALNTSKVLNFCVINNDVIKN